MTSMKQIISLVVCCGFFWGFSAQSDSLDVDNIALDSISSTQNQDTVRVVGLKLDPDSLADIGSSLIDENLLLENDILSRWDDVMNDPLKELYEFEEADSLWIANHESIDFSDTVYAERLHDLDLRSPIDYSYNSTVRSFINYYCQKKKHQTALVLGRSKMYFPMFEQILDEFDMPYELKYLAVVESSLRCDATSRMGAKGLWQFMYATGRAYGLEINSYVDERMDPEKATRAACQYLKYLHGLYQDWNLALAAYNAGPGNVNKAIRRSGGKRNYWQIRRYLPRETRSYVPIFTAVSYAFEYANEHQLRALPYAYSFFDTDTVEVFKQVDLRTVATYTGISYSELQLLNPVYKRGIIPLNKKGNTIRLPYEQVAKFWESKESILTEPVVQIPVIQKTKTPKGTLTYYRVRNGDVLGTIAQRHGVSVSQLKQWNNIRGTRIYSGQKLKIYANKAPISGYKKSKTPITASSKPSTGSRYHTIKSGDTLWDIAKLYPGVSVSDLKRWNNHINFRRLKPGQRIVVGK